MKLFLLGALFGAGSVLIFLAIFPRSSTPEDFRSTSGAFEHSNANPSQDASVELSRPPPRSNPEDRTLISQAHGNDLPSPRPTEESQSRSQVYPLAAPKSQSELTQVIALLSTATEDERNNALGRLHNYLVDHPEELRARLAIRNAAAYDASDRVRKHGLSLLAVSPNDADFQHVLDRLAMDTSVQVQIRAIEKLAMVSEPQYWVWLSKRHGRDEAKRRHAERLELVRQALESVVAQSASTNVRKASERALRGFPN